MFSPTKHNTTRFSSPRNTHFTHATASPTPDENNMNISNEIEVSTTSCRLKTLEKAVTLMLRYAKAADAALEAARYAAEIAHTNLTEAQLELKDAEASLESAKKKSRLILVPVPNSPVTDEVIVQGCEKSQVDGVYKQFGYQNGAPKYSKTIPSKRNKKDIQLYIHKIHHHWYI